MVARPFSIVVNTPVMGTGYEGSIPPAGNPGSSPGLWALFLILFISYSISSLYSGLCLTITGFSITIVEFQLRSLNSVLKLECRIHEHFTIS